MMNFRTIKNNLVTILTYAAAGRYRVLGHEVQTRDANEVKGSNRLVEVFYSGGEFPKSSSGVTDNTEHEVEYNVWLTVSEVATVDLSILNNEAATPAQKQGALAAAKMASSKCADSMDELIDILYQVIMDARNYDLGDTSPFIVSDRWIPRIRKGAIEDQGGLVVLTASMNVTCSIEEEITGDTGTPVGATIADSTYTTINGDANQKTGITK